jgi:hypothetical protein
LKQASKLIVALREHQGISDESLEEKDFKLRSVKDFTKNVCFILIQPLRHS